MVKILLILSFCFINEKRYTIESSKIEFYSYAPLEDITAINTESIGAIDLSTSEFLIKIPVSAFEFPNKLMQKHFNDSYLETDKYPECVFRGKIIDGVKSQVMEQVTGALGSSLGGLVPDATGPAIPTPQAPPTSVGLPPLP